jgi:hypothetical protein
MIAVAKFTVTIDGEQKTYRAGDKIPADVAKDFDLANKPKLAKSESKPSKTEE